MEETTHFESQGRFDHTPELRFFNSPERVKRRL